jgi:uncharacterized membrane protein YgdD (TMEM256/DUF423 family)
MSHTLFSLGSLSALIAVGAFGAHALESRLEPDLLTIFETGARYQMVHALGLLAVALASTRWPSTLWAWSGWCFVIGTVLFAGSLYALALSGQRWLGAITPLGGVCFLAGWLLAAIAAWRAAI